MTYNKKQMQPLIDKFQINPETNKLFAKIIEMYDNQPNYQIWAVKGVFSQTFDFETLAKIHDWSIINQTMIKSLEKKNIVSYLHIYQEYLVMDNIFKIQKFILVTYKINIPNKFPFEKPIFNDSKAMIGNYNQTILESIDNQYQKIIFKKY